MKGILALLVFASLLAQIGLQAEPVEYERWWKITDPGEPDGDIQGFRWLRVWKEGSAEQLTWKSRDRMFVYKKIPFSEVRIDHRQSCEWKDGRVGDFEMHGKMYFPLVGDKEQWVVGKVKPKGYEIEIKEPKKYRTTAFWGSEQFDEIWALDQRFIRKRSQVPVGESQSVRFFKPITNEMEVVEVETLRQEGDDMVYKLPFKDPTWEYWRSADNRITRLDFKKGTWIHVEKEKLFKQLPTLILEKSGLSENDPYKSN